MNRALVEIPQVTRLGPNRWFIRWTGCHSFEADDGAFTQLVRSLPRAAQRELFLELSQTK